MLIMFGQQDNVLAGPSNTVSYSHLSLGSLTGLMVTIITKKLTQIE